MATIPVETERKWVLHQHPARRQLDAWAVRIISIDQIYLPKLGDVRRRLRKSVSTDHIEYELCSKRRLSPGVAVESTMELSAAEYDLLLNQADPRRRMVRKTRWVFGPQTVCDHPGALELVVDHLIAPIRIWVAEVEYEPGTDLMSDLALPKWLGPSTEVTHLEGWTCASFARRGIPPDPVPSPAAYM